MQALSFRYIIVQLLPLLFQQQISGMALSGGRTAQEERGWVFLGHATICILGRCFMGNLLTSSQHRALDLAARASAISGGEASRSRGERSHSAASPCSKQCLCSHQKQKKK